MAENISESCNESIVPDAVSSNDTTQDSRYLKKFMLAK